MKLNYIVFHVELTKEAFMDKWRFINIDKIDPYTIMAINEVLLMDLKENTALIWEIKKSIILGYFQNPELELNLEKAKDYQITRRITGGGLAFADSKEKQLHYGIVAFIDDEKIPMNIEKSYEKICQIIVKTISHYKLDAEFVPINDVVINNKKISGSAQVRRENKLLQHGTLLIDFDIEEMLNITKIPFEKISDKAISSLRDRMTWLENELNRDIDIKEVKAIMKEKIAEVFDVELIDKPLTIEETRKVQDLIPKYIDEKWIYRGKKEFRKVKEGVQKARKGLIRVSSIVENGIIKDIIITGDFMMFPQEAFHNFENYLREIRAEERKIRRAVMRFYKENNIITVGAELEDFVIAIMKSLE